MSDPEYAAPTAPSIPSFADLLTPKQVSEMTGRPETVLAVYRSRRNTGRSPHAGPEFVKVGREVFYTRDAVRAYLAGKRG
ncbi:MAG: DNA-binding protein [Pseudomonadota bacterium]